jgi:hypothetical protein
LGAALRRVDLVSRGQVAHPDTPAAVWKAIQIAHVPVMIMHGIRDAMWTSAGPLKVYDSLPPDVYNPPDF